MPDRVRRFGLELSGLLRIATGLSPAYDQTHNLELWGIYNLPFGRGHGWASNGVGNAVLGGWQLNGQFSHISGTPFTVSANSNTANAEGEPLYANLVAPYHQLGGHSRIV